MRETTLTLPEGAGQLPVTWAHTLVVGSGAAGLNGALQLHNNGVEDVLIVSP